MAKGDDSVRRKKNKVQRKKLNRKNDSSTVSARIASIIAAKKRRKSGKRSMCQGMCFSLPTPDDPFNDRLDKKDISIKTMPSKRDQKVSAKREDNVPTKGAVLGNRELACESSDCPSKYLIICLKTIEDSLYPDGTYNGEEGKHLFVNPWGIEFWKCYSAGKDILETSGPPSDFEQIAWIASTAADVISRREKEGYLFTGPFILFIVPSKEKALRVRSLCKPLKAQGIHTVSLHSGASIDHQISGLQSCEPEFLVSTPERLLELISLKAIDISGVSMLVIDGMESTSGGCYLDTVKSIKQAISGKPHTTVFFNSFSNASVPAVQNLLNGSVYRLSLNDSVASQSACIIQSIHVCASKEEKIKKGIHALDNACSNQIIPQPLKVLYIVGKNNNVQKLASAIKFKGYSISTSCFSKVMEFENSLDCGRPAVSIIDTEHINSTDLGEYGVVIVPDYVPSVDYYVQILTRMARHTVNGILHSFLTKDDARHAGPLIGILEQCGLAVPEELKNL
ncbi:probable ATP-dependent RNA helicase ddx5 [Hibiscus syriacus]|uniref:probable ATP-dependent RNA helicase ddx5 n=1 Tax=Hibiscus syriacus TaxID=106335 RepID=UPI0019216407|nr:probable ATP-dependent RNA helicase ddx5 [Hibiscus syriacus]